MTERAPDVTMRAANAVLQTLTEFGVPVDIQELLVYGNPALGVRPGALSRAVATALHVAHGEQVKEKF